MSKAEVIAGGALRVPAVLTRADAIFEYRLPDGSMRREFRPKSEVMAPESLASFRSAPVTDLHPSGLVRLDNRRQLERGHIGDNVRADESNPLHVAADIIITDPAMIELVKTGQRQEISCGYECKLDHTPGEFNGQPYDVVQREIRGNHAGLGPKGWGRAGPEAALRLDSNGNEISPPSMRLDSQEKAPMATARIDGIDYDPTTPAFLQALEKFQARADAAQAQIDALTGERDKAVARADAAEGKVKTLEGELAKANDPERLDSLVAARETIKGQARKVLGADAKLDGLSDDEIRRKVLEAKGVKLDGKSDAYIEARFDAEVETAGGDDDAAAPRKPSAVSSARTDGAPAQARSDGAPGTRTQRKYQPPAWQQPTSLSAD